MVTDLLSMVAVVLLLALFPVVLLAGVFAIVDYLKDDEKLEEIRRAEREGRPIDFSGETTGGSSGDSDDLTPVAPPEELPTDEASTDASRSESAQSRPRDHQERTVSCSNCGRDNEASFGRCWNCQARL